jgi:hypothetical protein
MHGVKAPQERASMLETMPPVRYLIFLDVVGLPDALVAALSMAICITLMTQTLIVMGVNMWPRLNLQWIMDAMLET